MVDTYGYIDDISILVHGPPKDTTELCSTILAKCCKWAKTNRTEFDLGDKLGLLHFPSNTNAEPSKHRMRLSCVLPIISYANELWFTHATNIFNKYC